MVDRKRVEHILESVSDFDDPSLSQEQYLTPPDIASHILHMAAMRGDITDKHVVDLGTGTGQFAIGASLFEPSTVIGIDSDKTALHTAKKNEQAVFSTDAHTIEWINADIRHNPICTTGTTVFSNPPFGAHRRQRHADKPFILAASEIAAVSYTIHNSGSQSFIEAITEEYNGTVSDIIAVTLTVPKRFDHHSHQRKDIAAEMYRIDWNSD